MIFYSGGSSICLAGVVLWYIIETSVLAPIVLTFCLTVFLWCFPFIDLTLDQAIKIAFPVSIAFTVCVILFVIFKCITYHINKSQE